jgi:DNA-binding transcriptional LysR family regulator
MPQSIGTYYLPFILSQFQAIFSKVGFDIRTCPFDVLLHELRAGITDVAYLLADPIPFSELKTELLGVEPLVAVSSSNHPIAEKISWISVTWQTMRSFCQNMIAVTK